jgi:hypothetical protein
LVTLLFGRGTIPTGIIASLGDPALELEGLRRQACGFAAGDPQEPHSADRLGLPQTAARSQMSLYFH